MSDLLSKPFHYLFSNDKTQINDIILNIFKRPLPTRCERNARKKGNRRGNHGFA